MVKVVHMYEIYFLHMKIEGIKRKEKTQPDLCFKSYCGVGISKNGRLGVSKP